MCGPDRGNLGPGWFIVLIWVGSVYVPVVLSSNRAVEDQLPSQSLMAG